MKGRIQVCNDYKIMELSTVLQSYSINGLGKCILQL